MTESRGWGGGGVEGRGVWPEGRVFGPQSHALSRHPNPGSGISTLQDKGEKDPTPSVDSFSFPVLFGTVLLYKKNIILDSVQYIIDLISNSIHEKQQTMLSYPSFTL
jgi:hypothetical protein